MSLQNLTPEQIWEKAKAAKIGYVEYIRRYNYEQLGPRTPSRDPSLYILTHESYKRESSLDRHFRHQYLFQLLSIYNCRCAVCQSQHKGFHLDHHWLPKSYGGEFILTLKITGEQICNAVPLCSTCNISKSDNLNWSSPADTFIANTNRKVSAIINGINPEPIGSEVYRFSERDLPHVLRRAGRLYVDLVRMDDNSKIKWLNVYVGAE